MDTNWFTASWSALGLVMLTGLLNYLLLIVLTRLVGLRSFAKLSTFDFAIVIAIGSLVGATVLNREPPLAQGATALLLLFALQYAVSWLRRAYPEFGRHFDNQPMLLMAHGEPIEAHLAKVRVARAELHAAIRLAGIVRYDQIFAVIFESTGDMAVIPASAAPVDPTLFENVIGRERLFD